MLHNFPGIGPLQVIKGRDPWTGEVGEEVYVCQQSTATHGSVYAGHPVRVRFTVEANGEVSGGVEIVNPGTITSRQLTNCLNKWTNLVRLEVKRLKEEGKV